MSAPRTVNVRERGRKKRYGGSTKEREKLRSLIKLNYDGSHSDRSQIFIRIPHALMAMKLTIWPSNSISGKKCCDKKISSLLMGKENFRADMREKSSSFCTHTQWVMWFDSSAEIFIVKDGVALSRFRLSERLLAIFKFSTPQTFPELWRNVLSIYVVALKKNAFSSSDFLLFRFAIFSIFIMVFREKGFLSACACDCAGMEIQGPTENFWRFHS